MKISIVIPVLNEEAGIKGFLKSLIKQVVNPDKVEIIIVDGGSIDSTLNLVKDFKNINVISSEKGRAIQMNAGASDAKGEILYFLHSDSIPPLGFDDLIRNSITRGNSSGCFKMKFDEKHWMLQFFGWMTKFSSNLCRGGDQSLFVDKDVFHLIKGFDEQLILFEDTEIIPRLKEKGSFDVVKDELITSARKYRVNGIVRLQLIFGYLHFLYRLGYSQKSLLRVYNNHISN